MAPSMLHGRNSLLSSGECRMGGSVSGRRRPGWRLGGVGLDDGAVELDAVVLRDAETVAAGRSGRPGDPRGDRQEPSRHHRGSRARGGGARRGRGGDEAESVSPQGAQGAGGGGGTVPDRKSTRLN